MSFWDKLFSSFRRKSSDASEDSQQSDTPDGAKEKAKGKAKSKPKKRSKRDRLDVSARFELERQAFSGTMSKFRVAREIGTGKRLGIKFLNKEKTEHFEARFKGLNKPSEGEIGETINAVNSERIIETFDYGLTTQQEPYILMEYVHGPGLSSLIHEKSELLDPPGVRLNLIRQMAEALMDIHKAGFIHRDICPRNFICHHDVKWLKLIDFGLTVPDTASFRQPGNRTGTPLYMAPEIVRRRDTDQRVDIFSLGVTFFRLLTFEHPWSSGADTTGKAALAHDSFAPKDIRDLRPGIDEQLAKTVMKCIQPDRNKRPDKAESIVWALRKVQSEDA